MAAHLTEEEQIEALKRWWKENGKSTVAIIAIMLAGFFGWNQYKDHKEASANEGSVIFEKLISVAAKIDDKASPEQLTSIRSIADELVKHDKSSLYSDFAQLYAAKMDIDGGNIDSAVEILEKVSRNSDDPSLKELANLRLARILAAKGDIEKSLKLLSANVSIAYKAAYAETRGDVLLANKQIADAHKAYEDALQSMGVDQVMRKNLIQLKIDHTAVASKSSASSAESAEQNIPAKAGDA